MTDTKTMERVHGLGQSREAEAKALPHNLSAEAAVLGAILFDNGEYDRVREILRADDFYAAAHQALFQRAAALIETGQAADGVTLHEWSETEPHVRDVGGPQYLMELLDSAAFGPEIRDYSVMVRDLAARRAIISFGSSLQASGKSPRVGESPASIVSDAILRLRDLEEDKLRTCMAESAADVADDAFSGKATASLLRTGFKTLDHELGGFERGAVSLVAARPGVGKTAVGLCLCANVAKAGESVGFISLDMTRTVSLQRYAFFLAHLAGEDIPFFSEMRKPDSPWITQEFRERMKGHLRSDLGKRLMVFGKGSITTHEMNAQIRRWKRECIARGLPPLGAVVIDHIGKTTPAQTYRGLYEKTSYASNEVLEVAKEHEEVAFVALAQLNRVSAMEGRRPDMSDLRDSGKLEEDASAIVLLHREDLYLAKIAKNQSIEEDKRQKAEDELARVRGQIEFIIGKNRNGEVGAVTLRHVIGKNIIRDATREEPTQETMF